MSTHELSAKVRELKELQQLIEEATVEAEAIKDELKAHMKSSGTEEINAGVFKLRYSSVTSSRFDTKAFKAMHSELYEQFCKLSTSMRFSIA